MAGLCGKRGMRRACQGGEEVYNGLSNQPLSWWCSLTSELGSLCGCLR